MVRAIEFASTNLEMETPMFRKMLLGLTGAATLAFAGLGAATTAEAGYGYHYKPYYKPYVVYKPVVVYKVYKPYYFKRHYGYRYHW